MSDAESERSSAKKALIAILIVGVMLATSFAVVAQVLQHSRAEQLSEIPLQWRSYANAAIERGDISSTASPAVVKDWLSGRMNGLSEKVKTSWVNPFAAKVVAENEALGATGTQEPTPVTGTGKILVLLVEFNGSDTYKGVTYTGPLHNQMPPPAPENNVDYWISDFNQQHYEDLLFGSDGLTLANYYKQQSGGLYTVDGTVTAWIQLPHSEWYYGADSRTGGEGSDDLNGPVWRLAIDAAKAAYDRYGNAIPWAEFDADGNGWIDSLMVIRAGQDQSAGAPSWTVWAHSWFANFPDGYQVAPGLPKVGPYTTEPENEAVGVYAHEYGHQLGLPDEYDVTYLGESPVGFLSLMASGSWGPGLNPADGRMVLGLQPCDINVWGKWVLGWENGATKYFNYDGTTPVSGEVEMSQVENGPGTRAVMVELPRQAVALPLPTPHSGTYQWYSGYKPDISDVMAPSESSSYILTSASPINIPAAGATLSFYEWYDIEPYFDFAFVQASSDNGGTWTSLAGRHTTDSNPNGGNPGNGITGSSKHYVRETMDLSAFAGKSILLRFVLTQDGAVYGLGWTIDDISVVSGKTVVFQDLVSPESQANWVKSATDELGPGWSISTADAGGSFRHYYIMEWRNFVGFDQTLATSYQYVGLYVQFWSHTPGLMVWYRNFAMGDNMVGYHPGRVAIGVVDSHPEPLLMPDGSFVRQRIQLMDAAFGLRDTIANTITLQGVPTTFPSLPAAPTFDDSKPYFYYAVKGSSMQYVGLQLPTLGVTATVLTEQPGLIGATVSINAAPPAP